MGIDLQGTLRSLCFNTEWNYAVFWKLKYRARMVLTWEDAYYENCEPHDLFENKCFRDTLEKMCEGHYSHDPLGLAVAKMSYHVYSLGEGIVGQVAVTGKHEWIIVPDKHVTSSISSFEFSDGWHSQFSAGIKTVVVVAVVPYGVVQLGSFIKVAEDVKLVNHIKDIFSYLQDSSFKHSTTQYDIKNPSYLLDLPPKAFEGSEPEVITDSLSNLDKAIATGGPDGQLPTFPNLPKHGDNPSYFGSLKNGTENLEYQAESSLGASNTFLKFSAGFELHEALGPAFSKGCHYLENEAEKIESISISGMTCDSGSENLLEAVVGNLCYSGSDCISEKSCSKSSQSLLMSAEKTPNSSSHIEHMIQSSGRSMSSKGFSSNCPSGYSEQLDRHSVPAKSSKKRARPGENSKPRPRDRQLIQDRIKELRELVPNGAKCSIDSLLERTIKHMIFMESITNHADKLNNCAESKMHQKALDTSNYEKGSSWAVEIGGHLKVSSIIVENLNKNGQMLVEMLCEECSHFLEIAEAIRSLGLTILKGVTKKHGDKTWICFIVEGQNNRVMHRMDILWSLVQTLQPKT